MNPDFDKFHKSIGEELLAVKDRVRNLIGMANAGEEGRYKEEILKRVIREHLPEKFSVDTGFILGQKPSVSKQIDIIIHDKEFPVIFRSGDFVIVTGEGVRAIIEVKTKVTPSSLKKVVPIASNNGIVAMSGHTGPLDFFNGVFCFKRSAGSVNSAFKAIKHGLEQLPRSQMHAVAGIVCLGADSIINIYNGELCHNEFPGLAMSAFLFELLRHLQPAVSSNTKTIYFHSLVGMPQKKAEPLSMKSGIGA